MSKVNEIEFRFKGEFNIEGGHSFEKIYKFLKDVGIDVIAKNDSNDKGKLVVVKKINPL